MKHDLTPLLTMPQPCGEDWDAMTPIHNGRLCAACDRLIVDMVDMSSKEIARLMEGNNDRVCARVGANQLTHAKNIEQETSLTKWSQRIVFAISAALATGVSLQSCSIHKGQGQEIQQTTPSQLVLTSDTIKASSKLVYEGKVVHDMDSLPIEGAVVMNPRWNFASVTDEQGLFHIDIPDSLSNIPLTFQFIYLNTQLEERTWRKGDPATIVRLIENPPVFIGLIDYRLPLKPMSTRKK